MSGPLQFIMSHPALITDTHGGGGGGGGELHNTGHNQSETRSSAETRHYADQSWGQTINNQSNTSVCSSEVERWHDVVWCFLTASGLESNLLVPSRAKLGSDWRRMVQKLHPSSNKAAKCPTTPIHTRETLAYLLLYISVRLLAKHLTNHETCLTETFRVFTELLGSTQFKICLQMSDLSTACYTSARFSGCAQGSQRFMKTHSLSFPRASPEIPGHVSVTRNTLNFLLAAFPEISLTFRNYSLRCVHTAVILINYNV